MISTMSMVVFCAGSGAAVSVAGDSVVSLIAAPRIPLGYCADEPLLMLLQQLVRVEQRGREVLVVGHLGVVTLRDHVSVAIARGDERRHEAVHDVVIVVLFAVVVVVFVDGVAVLELAAQGKVRGLVQLQRY